MDFKLACRLFICLLPVISANDVISASSVMAQSLEFWKDLGQSAAAVLASFPEKIRKCAFHTRVCLSTDKESVDLFLNGLNDAKSPAAVSIWSGRSCENSLLKTTYKDSETYLLLGGQSALLNYLKLIKELVSRNSINISTTLWLFVTTEPDNEQFQKQLELAVPERIRMVLLANKSVQKSRKKRNPVEHLANRDVTRDLKNSHFAIIRENLENWQLDNSTQRSKILSYNISRNTRMQHSNSDENQPSFLVYVARPLANGLTQLERVGLWERDSGLDLWMPLEMPSPSNFQNRRMTLTTVHKPLVFEIRGSNQSEVNSLEEVNGYVAEVVRVLQGDLNFTTKLIFTNTFGTELENGSWNGMMGDLARKEADLSPLDFSPSWDRAQAVDFSEWFGTDEVIVISQAARSVSKPFLMLEIFSVWVWLAIIGTGIVTGVLLLAIDCILNRASGDWNAIDRSSLQQLLRKLQGTVGMVLKLFLIQGSKGWPSTWAGRILSACFFLVVISVVTLYQGYIIAFLAAPRKASPIDSATDLMQRLDKVTPIVRKNTVYYTFVVNFESYRPIAENLEFHQDSFLNTWEFFKLIQKGVYALIDTYSSGVGRAAAFESRGEACRFHISKNVLKNDWDQMAHAQNSVFREQIDRKIRQLRSFGIIGKIKKQYYTASCERDNHSRGHSSLSITKVQSAFYVVAAGMMLSGLVFITENMAQMTRNLF